jgi:preprotein translocase subunit SecE
MASEASEQANRAEIDPKRFVIISYLLLGLVVAFFFANILTRLFVEVGIGQRQLITGIELSTPPYLLGFVLAVGTGIYCWLNPRIHQLSLEVATELKRVTWPSWEETRVSTFAVVVASLVAAVILSAIDALSLRLMVDWLPILWEKVAL